MQYALNTPIIFFILLGAIPKPLQAPAEIVLEDVTKGYVPKSISNSVPCAPSARIFLPFDNAEFKKYSLSIKFNFLIFFTALSQI